MIDAVDTLSQVILFVARRMHCLKTEIDSNLIRKGKIEIALREKTEDAVHFPFH